MKYQRNWEVISSYPFPRVCLKNSADGIFPKPKIDRLLSRLINFICKIKSRGYHAFLEVKLVGFDLNLIALGIIYNFSHPLPGQFHYRFTQWRSTLGYPQWPWLTVREQQQKQKVK